MMLMADMDEGARRAVRLLHAPALPHGSELLEIVPILWSGWECDTHAALVRRPDGTHRMVVMNAVSHPGDQTVRQLLRERVLAYERAIQDTQRMLDMAYDFEAQDRIKQVRLGFLDGQPDPGGETDD